MDRRSFISSASACAFLAGCKPRPVNLPALTLLGEDSSNAKAIRAYLERHPDTLSKCDIDLETFDKLEEKSIVAFTEGANTDIILGYNFDLPKFVQNDYIFDVESLKRASAKRIDFSFEEDILPNVWKELGSYPLPPFSNFEITNTIAYPFCANTMVLVYSEHVFSDPKVAKTYTAKYGHGFQPPLTWQEFADVARLVSIANKEFKGVALQGAASGDWLYYEWMNFLFGMGGKVMDKDYGWQSNLETPLTLRTVEAASAAELYVSLKPVNAGNFLTVDALAQRDLMLNHNVAFAIMWTDYIPDMAKAGGFGFAPIPGEKSMIAGGSFFVNRKARRPGDCTEVIARLLSKGAQLEMALNGLFPPTRAALNDPSVQAKPYMPAVRTSLERGGYMLEAGPDSTLISDSISAALQAAWQGELPASQVGNRATSLVQTGRKQLGQQGHG